VITDPARKRRRFGRGLAWHANAATNFGFVVGPDGARIEVTQGYYYDRFRHRHYYRYPREYSRFGHDLRWYRDHPDWHRDRNWYR
jgi:hypothetical protein